MSYLKFRIGDSRFMKEVEDVGRGRVPRGVGCWEKSFWGEFGIGFLRRDGLDRECERQPNGAEMMRRESGTVMLSIPLNE